LLILKNQKVKGWNENKKNQWKKILKDKALTKPCEVAKNSREWLCERDNPIKSKTRKNTQFNFKKSRILKDKNKKDKKKRPKKTWAT
jgi:hypothetical protein